MTFVFHETNNEAALDTVTMARRHRSTTLLLLYFASSLHYLCVVDSKDSLLVHRSNNNIGKHAAAAAAVLNFSPQQQVTVTQSSSSSQQHRPEGTSTNIDSAYSRTEIEGAAVDADATSVHQTEISLISSPRSDRLRPSRTGPLSSWARAAADLGDGVRACAENACREVAAGTAACGDVLRRRIAGGRVTIRGSGVGGVSSSNALAFGKLLHHGEFARPAEFACESPEMAMLRLENDASVEAVMALIESDGWDHVTRKHGVTVVKKFMPPPLKSSSRAAAEGGGAIVDRGAAAKFACVKAYGTLDADAAEVYKLFLDNERVHEYNDNCRQVKDLERFSPDTKVSWAASPRYGPFKSRDFVTIVHYRTLEDGTMVVVNRPVEHADARQTNRYVRAEILIATNIMRRNPMDPTKTDFVSVTHINPGGIVDSKMGAKIVNALCAKAPVKLLISLERAANCAPVSKQEDKAKQPA